MNVRNLSVAATLSLFALPLAAATLDVDLNDLPAANDSIGGNSIIGDLAPGFGSDGPVTLNWRPLEFDDEALRFWPEGYSGSAAAFCFIDACRLDVSVDPGSTVTLESFSLGGFFNLETWTNYSVTDTATSEIVASSDFAVISGETGLLVTVGASSTSGFSLIFGPDFPSDGFTLLGSSGLTGLTYSYSTTTDSSGDDMPDVIPLPAAGWMLLTALGGLALAARRRRDA